MMEKRLRNRRIIRKLLFPISIVAMVIGLIRFLVEMTWSISTKHRDKIVFYLGGKIK